CRPGGRLDMSHGFVRHIRRNQIARYRHRWGPEPAPGPSGEPSASGSARTPVVSPVPSGGPGGDASPGPSPSDGRGPRLFCLEYEGDDGHVTTVIVHQGDSAEEVTRRVCARSPLEPALRRALCQRVQDELGKRQ
ncbi:CB068 protein, partial [Heliornis fulica]|nr:CB068 protein [Heliornis fulica]